MLVRLNSTLRSESGGRQLHVSVASGASVYDALLAAQAGDSRVGSLLLNDSGQVRQDLLVLCNGRNIRLLPGMDTPLAVDDRLDLFPLPGAQWTFAVD